MTAHGSVTGPIVRALEAQAAEFDAIAAAQPGGWSADDARRSAAQLRAVRTRIESGDMRPADALTWLGAGRVHIQALRDAS